MRRGRLIAALLLLLTGGAAADTIEVNVRSGEHADFSRLVLEFPERPDWSTRVDEDLAVLSFATGEWDFRTAAVFDFIGRSRIKGVSQTSTGTLTLELACACPVEVFPIRQGALVIDVKDEPAPLAMRNVIMTSSEADPSQPALLPVPTVLARSPVMPLPDDIWRFELPSAASPDTAPVAVEGTLPPDFLEAPGQAPPAPEADLADPVLSLDTLTRSLAEQVGRAASSGLLRPAQSFEDARTEGPSPPQSGAQDTLPGVRFRSPGEEPDLSVPDPLGTSAPLSNCPPERDFDLANWIPEDTTPPEAIAQARQRLFGELDRTDEDAALALARLYVAFGFGAEAQAVLTSTLPTHPDAKLLSELAGLIDDTEDDRMLLRDLVGCPGRAQLWTFLAHPEASSPYSEEILVSMAELPLHLRRLLGPRLSTYLDAQGDRAAAETVVQLVARAPGPHGVSVDLWQANEQAKEGDRAGVRLLEDLATGASPVSAEALVSYLEFMIEGGSPAETSFVELAEARAREMNGTPLGDRLAAGLFRTHLIRGEFAVAYDRLRPMDGSTTDTASDTLHDEFLSALTRNGDDADFLRHGADLVATLPAGIRQETALMAANRMAELGFGQIARKYLNVAAAGRESDILSARIALGQNDPEAALRDLGIIEGGDADLLRAEILSRAGRHAEAADLFGRSGDAPRAGASLWLSGDWNRIVAAADPTRAQAAELVSGPERTSAGDPVDLLARSEDARSRLETLLEAIPEP